VDKGGQTAIVLFVILSLLDVWGLNVYDFLLSRTGLVKTLVQVPLIVLTAIVVLQLAYLAIRKLESHARAGMVSEGKAPASEIEKRVSTVGRIIRRICQVAIITVAGMMVMAELGFDIKPVLAGAGILGLAVGFGAQNLVKDVISGLFLIVENLVRVGDVAVLNGTGGLVEQVNLRTTVLRDLSGVVHVFPNGSINSVSNMTLEFSYYVFDVSVAYQEDTDRVVAALKEIGDEMMKEEEYRTMILEPLEVFGVDQFASSAVVIKARIKTVPVKQWLVGREMNRRIKKRFDELGIEIPFPQISVSAGPASRPLPLTIAGLSPDREALKQLVREVLQELRENSTGGENPSQV